MSGFNAFLKQNKKKEEFTKVKASKNFIDENGEVVEWEIRPLKSKEAERIRNEFRKIKGGKITSFDSAGFNKKVAATCTVVPDLNVAELQDSYGVVCAEDLIVEMLDNDGEYQTYVEKILEISGYKKSDEDLKEEAKN